eukprot:3939958-Heterocapsa_arctica.AAC.1
MPIELFQRQIRHMQTALLRPRIDLPIVFQSGIVTSKRTPTRPLMHPRWINISIRKALCNLPGVGNDQTAAPRGPQVKLRKWK